MFLTEDEVLIGGKTLIKLSVRDINFVDLCSWVGIVWSTRTRTRVTGATAVTFSVKYIHLYSPMNGRKNAKQYKNNAVTLTIRYVLAH